MFQSLFPTVPMALAPQEELPCKEQVVPFTVSPRAAAQPFPASYWEMWRWMWERPGAAERGAEQEEMREGCAVRSGFSV